MVTRHFIIRLTRLGLTFILLAGLLNISQAAIAARISPAVSLPDEMVASPRAPSNVQSHTLGKESLDTTSTIPLASPASYDLRSTLAISPTYTWHTFYGSSGTDSGQSIAVDGNGNVYIVGLSDATWQGDNNANPLHAHSGGYNLIVLKLNSSGMYQWHTFYGITEFGRMPDIAVDDSGNVYVAGISTATWQGDNNTDPLHAFSGGNDFVVVKLNGSGTYQWHTFYGGSSGEDGTGIAVDRNGYVYVAGSSPTTWQGDNNADPLHAHSGGSNLTVFKLNGSGAYQWHTFYGSGSAWSKKGIAVDGSGNIYITGNSLGWQGDNNTDPIHAFSGGVFADLMAVKLNSNGVYQWHTFYGSSDFDRGLGIAVDGSGNVYVTGYSSATWQGDNNTDPLQGYVEGYDTVVVKLDGSGVYHWHTFRGIYGTDWGNDITTDSSDGIYIAQLRSGFGVTAFKLSGSGAYQWRKSCGSGASIGIALDASSDIYIAGDSATTWQGDNNTDPLHAHSGLTDITALKLFSPYTTYLPLVMR